MQGSNPEESLAVFESMVQAAVDAIITIDPLGTILTVNPAVHRLFGYTDEELLGRNISILMPDPYRSEHDGYIQAYVATRIPKVIGSGREVVARRKDGSTFPIHLAISETRVNERLLFTGIVRDISELKQLEREVLNTSSEEQGRIGRDLHDGLGQELTGIALLAGALGTSLGKTNPAAAKDAARIVSLVNGAIDHTRALVRGLVPVTVDEEGLMISLEELVDSVNRAQGPACHFHNELPAPVDNQSVALQLYYIASEAVNNALKHAEAKNIWVTLTVQGRQGRLMVSDDGMGFTFPLANQGGRGLHMMHYRTRHIGGILTIGAREGGGMVVDCHFDPHHASNLMGGSHAE